MPTLEALFAEICAHPTDMEPRREYAKLVGGERGRLIDVQLQSDAQLKAGGRRILVDKLLKIGEPDQQHRMSEWAAPLTSAAIPISFIRGFMEFVEVDAMWFVHHYEELFKSAPVRHLGLSNVNTTTTCDALSACKGLRQICALYFAGSSEPGLLSSLAHCANMFNVKYIMMHDSRFNDAHLDTFLKNHTSVDAFICPAFAEELHKDWDGTILNISAPERLLEFDKSFDYYNSIHLPNTAIDPDMF